MNAVVILLAATAAVSSALPFHYGYQAGYPFYNYGGYLGYPTLYPGHTHRVVVPVELQSHPFVHDPSGNTVPFGVHGGDENMDGLPDFQDTNRDAKVDPKTRTLGFKVGYMYHH